MTTRSLQKPLQAARLYYVLRAILKPLLNLFLVSIITFNLLVIRFTAISLGIKHHGTSHLLITREDAERIASSLRENRPHGAPLSVSDFESLSPIYFYDVEDLGKKISSLKPKGAKNRPGDTSQANRGYDKARDDIYRGAFEHGR